MEIDLRVSDDYCQGEASVLYPLEEEFYEEDKINVRLKITPRGCQTR